MFSFLSPVKPQVAVACFYLAASVGVEVLTTRQTGRAISAIQNLKAGSASGSPHLLQWLFHAGWGPVAIGRGLFSSSAVTGSSGSSDIGAIVLGLALLVGLIVALRYLREVANMKMSMSMVFYIREAVYDKLQRVGFGFHDAVSSGQLINRALTDLNNVRQFVQLAVLNTVEIVLIVTGYIVLLITVSPWIALLALLPLPLWVIYILRFSRIMQPATAAVMEADDRNVSVITEATAGVHVIKAFAIEQQEVDRYDRNCEDFLARVLRRMKLFADFQPIVRLIAMLSSLTLLLVGGILLLKGKILAGEFVIIPTAMNGILSRLQLVATINEQYQNAIVSARRLWDVLQAAPTVPEAPDAKPLPTGSGAVEFSQVTFGYDPEKPVLHEVNCSIKGGSVVAVVGPTGAGKSTLVSLIARFYDPQTGSVKIDGMDVRKATLKSLRSEVAFVFQETYLFSDTVAANISYSRPHTSAGEIEAAARLAQAHDFIEELPQGYQTMLGERGSSLSGGQRQRLAIARAIVSNPRVLVLDDATAAIDAETETLIRKAMRFVMQGRTTFVIAHRISTVKQADLVLVLENGRVTQAGTHRQLIEQDGHYRYIAAVQLQPDTVTPPELAPMH
jgi:ATP-binding cassette subfamily B protein